MYLLGRICWDLLGMFGNICGGFRRYPLDVCSCSFGDFLEGCLEDLQRDLLDIIVLERISLGRIFEMQYSIKGDQTLPLVC